MAAPSTRSTGEGAKRRLEGAEGVADPNPRQRPREAGPPGQRLLAVPLAAKLTSEEEGGQNGEPPGKNHEERQANDLEHRNHDDLRPFDRERPVALSKMHSACLRRSACARQTV